MAQASYERGLDCLFLLWQFPNCWSITNILLDFLDIFGSNTKWEIKVMHDVPLIFSLGISTNQSLHVTQPSQYSPGGCHVGPPCQIKPRNHLALIDRPRHNLSTVGQMPSCCIINRDLLTSLIAPLLLTGASSCYLTGNTEDDRIDLSNLRLSIVQYFVTTIQFDSYWSRGFKPH